MDTSAELDAAPSMVITSAWSPAVCCTPPPAETWRPVRVTARTPLLASTALAIPPRQVGFLGLRVDFAIQPGVPGGQFLLLQPFEQAEIAAPGGERFHLRGEPRALGQSEAVKVAEANQVGPRGAARGDVFFRLVPVPGQRVCGLLQGAQFGVQRFQFGFFQARLRPPPIDDAGQREVELLHAVWPASAFSFATVCAIGSHTSGSCRKNSRSLGRMRIAASSLGLEPAA